MTDTPAEPVPVYEICIKGRLDPRWVQWFDGVAIALDAHGNARLRGPVADQAALHGLLKRVRDLGLTLLSVNTLGPETEGGHAPQSLSPS